MNAFRRTRYAQTWPALLTILALILLASGPQTAKALPYAAVSAPPELMVLIEGYKYTQVRNFDGANGQSLATPPTFQTGNIKYLLERGSDGAIYLTGSSFDYESGPIPPIGIQRFTRETLAPQGAFVAGDNATSFVFGSDGILYVQYGDYDELGNNDFGGSIARFNGLTGASLGTLIEIPDDESIAPLGVGADDKLYTFNQVNSGGSLGEESCVKRYNRQTGALLDTLFCIPTPAAYSSAFGPDGHFYFSAFGSSIARYNITNGTLSGTLSCPGDTRYSDIAFGPDGTLYAVSGRIEFARFNISTSECLGHIALAGIEDDDNGFQPGIVDFLVLPALNGEANGRVTSGLQALYDFDEGSGKVVHDVSGVGNPLDLKVKRTSQVRWAAGGLRITGTTAIASSGPATKLINAAKASDELTVEVWVTPADREQFSARIMTISSDSSRRNFSLIQGLFDTRTTSLVSARLRTTNTTNDGARALLTGANTLPPKLTHIVYTRAVDGVTRIYIDGVQKASATVGGTLDNWDASYGLFLGDEATSGRGWRGTYHLVAMYERALSGEEVQQNFAAGSEATP